MSASASRPLRQPERFGRLWWLPDRGEGNGLDDTAWAPLADCAPGVARALLHEMTVAGVPAYAAPVDRHPLRPRKRAVGRYRVWVGTSRYGQAEEVMRIRLPALLRTLGGA